MFMFTSPSSCLPPSVNSNWAFRPAFDSTRNITEQRALSVHRQSSTPTKQCALLILHATEGSSGSQGQMQTQTQGHLQMQSQQATCTVYRPVEGQNIQLIRWMVSPSALHGQLLTLLTWTWHDVSIVIIVHVCTCVHSIQDGFATTTVTKPVG